MAPQCGLQPALALLLVSAVVPLLSVQGTAVPSITLWSFDPADPEHAGIGAFDAAKRPTEKPGVQWGVSLINSETAAAEFSVRDCELRAQFGPMRAQWSSPFLDVNGFEDISIELTLRYSAGLNGAGNDVKLSVVQQFPSNAITEIVAGPGAVPVLPNTFYSSTLTPSAMLQFDVIVNLTSADPSDFIALGRVDVLGTPIATLGEIILAQDFNKPLLNVTTMPAPMLTQPGASPADCAEWCRANSSCVSFLFSNGSLAANATADTCTFSAQRIHDNNVPTQPVPAARQPSDYYELSLIMPADFAPAALIPKRPVALPLSHFAMQTFQVPPEADERHAILLRLPLVLRSADTSLNCLDRRPFAVKLCHVAAHVPSSSNIIDPRDLERCVTRTVNITVDDLPHIGLLPDELLPVQDWMIVDFVEHQKGTNGSDNGPPDPNLKLKAFELMAAIIETAPESLPECAPVLWAGAETAPLDLPAPNGSAPLPLFEPSHTAQETLDGSVAVENLAAVGATTVVMDVDGAFDGEVSALHFPAITIPPHATVHSAYVQYTSSTSTAGSVNVSVSLDTDPHSAAPVTGTSSYSLSARLPSDPSAAVLWTIPTWSSDNSGPSQQTPDLSQLFAAKVREGLWEYGNPVTVLVKRLGNSSDTHKAYASDYTGNLSNGPRLVLNFTVDDILLQSVHAASQPAPALLSPIMGLYKPGDCSFPIELTSSVGGKTLIRWPRVNIPQNASIVAAHVVLLGAASNFAVATNISAELGSSAPLEAEDLPANLQPTRKFDASTSVPWLLPATTTAPRKLVSPDLSAVVQAAISDSSWTIDSALTLRISGFDTTYMTECVDGRLAELRILYKESANSVSGMVINYPTVIAGMLGNSSLVSANPSMMAFGTASNNMSLAAMLLFPFLPPLHGLHLERTRLQLAAAPGSTEGQIKLDIDTVGTPFVTPDDALTVGPFSGLPLMTSSQVIWQPANWTTNDTRSDETLSPDLSGLLAATVALSDWIPTSPIAFHVATSAASSLRVAHAAISSPDLAPTLSIEYIPVTHQARLLLSSVVLQTVTENVTVDVSNITSAAFSLTGPTTAIQFDAAPIPRGARVSSAFVQFVSGDDSGSSASEAVTFAIGAEMAGNPPPLRAGPYSLGPRMKHSAGLHVSWSPLPWTNSSTASVAQRTPDLAALLQRMVDSDFWNPGHPIQLLIAADAAGPQGSRMVSNTHPAALVVHYTLPDAACKDKSPAIDSDVIVEGRFFTAPCDVNTGSPSCEFHALEGRRGLNEHDAAVQMLFWRDGKNNGGGNDCPFSMAEPTSPCLQGTCGDGPITQACIDSVVAYCSLYWHQDPGCNNSCPYTTPDVWSSPDSPCAHAECMQDAGGSGGSGDGTSTGNSALPAACLDVAIPWCQNHTSDPQCNQVTQCPFDLYNTNSPCYGGCEQANASLGWQCCATIVAYCRNASDPACATLTGNMTTIEYCEALINASCPLAAGAANDSPCLLKSCAANFVRPDPECVGAVQAYCYSTWDDACISSPQFSDPECPFLPTPASPCVHPNCSGQSVQLNNTHHHDEVTLACFDYIGAYCTAYSAMDPLCTQSTCPMMDKLTLVSPCMDPACATTDGEYNSTCLAVMDTYCDGHSFHEPACNSSCSPFEDKFSQSSLCRQPACSTFFASNDTSDLNYACCASTFLYCATHSSEPGCQEGQQMVIACTQIIDTECPFNSTDLTVESPCVYSACVADIALPTPKCREYVLDYCFGPTNAVAHDSECNNLLYKCPFDLANSDETSPCLTSACAGQDLSPTRSAMSALTPACLGAMHTWCSSGLGSFIPDPACAPSVCDVPSPFLEATSPCLHAGCTGEDLSITGTYDGVVSLICTDTIDAHCIAVSTFTGPYCSAVPTMAPTNAPTFSPTSPPTGAPTLAPTSAPTISCSDGIKNGLETGLDCGGPVCAPCPVKCPADTLPQYPPFSETLGGTIVSVSCGDGFEGTVSRVCCGAATLNKVGGSGLVCTVPLYGQWLSPNTDDCKNTQLQALNTTVLNLNQSNIASAMDSLVNATNGAKGKMGVDDAVVSVNMMRAVLGVSRTTNTSMLQNNLAKNFVKAAGDLLRSNNAVLTKASSKTSTGAGAQAPPKNGADMIDELLSDLSTVILNELKNGPNKSSDVVEDDIVLTVNFVPDKAAFGGYEWPSAALRASSPDLLNVTLPPGLFAGLDNATGGISVVLYRQVSPFSSGRRPASSVLSVSLEGLPGKTITALPETVNLTFTLETDDADTLAMLVAQILAQRPDLSPSQISNVTVAGVAGSTKLLIRFIADINGVPTASSLNGTLECGFFDLVADQWSSDGLLAVGVPWSDQEFTCISSHLTNFAVLVAVDNEASPSSAAGEALSIITYIGLSVSVVLMVVLVVTFVALRKRKFVKTPQHISINLALALIGAQVIFLTAIESASDDSELCTAVAGLLHYFLLVAFMWMLGQAIHIWMSFVKVLPGEWTQERVYRVLFLAAWLAPMAVVLLSMVLASDDYGTDDYCWIDMSSSLIYAFLVPLGVIMVFNCYVFFKAVHAVRNSGHDAVTVKASISFFALLGLTWITAAFVASDPTLVSQFAFAILNSLQGAVLFYFSCWRSKHVRAIYHSIFCCSESHIDDEFFVSSSEGQKPSKSKSNQRSTQPSGNKGGRGLPKSAPSRANVLGGPPKSPAVNASRRPLTESQEQTPSTMSTGTGGGSQGTSANAPSGSGRLKQPAERVVRKSVNYDSLVQDYSQDTAGATAGSTSRGKSHNWLGRNRHLTVAGDDSGSEKTATLSRSMPRQSASLARNSVCFYSDNLGDLEAGTGRPGDDAYTTVDASGMSTGGNYMSVSDSVCNNETVNNETTHARLAVRKESDQSLERDEDADRGYMQVDMSEADAHSAMSDEHLLESTRPSPSPSPLSLCPSTDLLSGFSEPSSSPLPPSPLLALPPGAREPGADASPEAASSKQLERSDSLLEM